MLRIDYLMRSEHSTPELNTLLVKTREKFLVYVRTHHLSHPHLRHSRGTISHTFFKLAIGYFATHFLFLKCEDHDQDQDMKNHHVINSQCFPIFFSSLNAGFSFQAFLRDSLAHRPGSRHGIPEENHSSLLYSKPRIRIP